MTARIPADPRLAAITDTMSRLCTETQLDSVLELLTAGPATELEDPASGSTAEDKPGWKTPEEMPEGSTTPEDNPSIGWEIGRFASPSKPPFSGAVTPESSLQATSIAEAKPNEANLKIFIYTPTLFIFQ